MAEVASTAEQQTMVDAYLGGATLQEASAICGRSTMAAINALKRQGIARRSQSVSHRKYSHDDRFFDIIDTEEKAYWTGFIAADGSICAERNVLEVGLKTGDEIHLHKLATAVKSNRPICHKIDRRWIPPCHLSRFSINSPRIVAALDRIGISSVGLGLSVYLMATA